MCTFLSKSGGVPFQPLGDLTWNDPAAKWTCLSWILLKLLTPLPTSGSSGSWKAMASMATCTDGYSCFLKEEPKE